MKGFRNYLVHRYGSLEDDVAYADIKNGLKDFDKILAELKQKIRNH